MLTTIAALVLVGQQQMPFDMRASSPSLLKHEAVRRELRMTPAQSQTVLSAMQAYKERSKSSKRWDSNEERSAVLKHLDGAQLKRLREISLQESGPIVLIVDFIAARIGADEKRQKQIESVFEASIDASMKPVEERVERMVDETMKEAGDDPEKIRAKADEVSKKADQITDSIDHDAMEKKAAADLLASLTPSERKAWDELLGKPFPVKDLKQAK